MSGARSIPHFGAQGRFIPGGQRAGAARPVPSSAASSSTPSSSRATQLGLGLGKGKGKAAAGLGAMGLLKRHRKIQRDTIRGITKGDIRRLARRGGIKRISSTVYDDIRDVLKDRLNKIMHQVTAIVESSGRKVVTVQDVIFTLNRMGKPIYGFDASFDGRHRLG